MRAQGVGNFDVISGIQATEFSDNGAVQTAELQGVLSNYGGGTLDVACSEPGPSNASFVEDAVLTAIKVGSVNP